MVSRSLRYDTTARSGNSDERYAPLRRKLLRGCPRGARSQPSRGPAFHSGWLSAPLTFIGGRRSPLQTRHRSRRTRPGRLRTLIAGGTRCGSDTADRAAVQRRGLDHGIAWYRSHWNGGELRPLRAKDEERGELDARPPIGEQQCCTGIVTSRSSGHKASPAPKRQRGKLTATNTRPYLIILKISKG
jgi:hypothetical protein